MCVCVYGAVVVAGEINVHILFYSFFMALFAWNTINHVQIKFANLFITLKTK